MTDIPKFRIVKRDSSYHCYRAQRKVWDLFWVDCNQLESKYSIKEKTYSKDLWVVEKYIKQKIEQYRSITKEDEVIATYHNGEKIQNV